VTRQAYQTMEYREQAVMGSSPIHLVIMALDAAINACEVKNFEKSTRAVCILRDALDFEQGSISVDFFRLYQWCLDCIRRDDFDAAMRTLRPLRDAWVEVEKRATQTSSTSWSSSQAA
jgi:flagellin-specific chaperone FliS